MTYVPGMNATWDLPVLLAAFLSLLSAAAAPPPPAAGAPPTNSPVASGPASSAPGLLLNLRGAPLSEVLAFLGQAAGVELIHTAEPNGQVRVRSTTPLQREETLQLLNTVLKQNGYALLREGQTLTLLHPEQARTADLPVRSGCDPQAVEPSEEMALQIIPVRYATAGQLLNNLQTILPSTATLAANESANTLLLVATQAEIRRALQIIQVLDNSLASLSTIRVFPLRYGDAKELASQLQQLFASPRSGQTTSLADQNGPGFGMGPGGGDFGPGPGGFGPPGGGFGPPGPAGPPDQSLPSSSRGGSTSRGAAHAKVTIVADERSNSLVVSGPADLLPNLARVIEQCDQPGMETTLLRRFRLRHADPLELAAQLTQLFGSATNGTSQDQPTPFVMGPPPPFFGGGPPGMGDGAPDVTGTHRRKQSQVQAVADPRTTSVLVSASSSVMPQVARLIAQLDANPGYRETVQTFELRYADPQDIAQALQDLFNRTSGARANDNRNSLLGQNNPLSARQLEPQQTTSTEASRSENAGGPPGGGGALPTSAEP